MMSITGRWRPRPDGLLAAVLLAPEGPLWRAILGAGQLHEEEGERSKHT
jgi:hypothetical protein